MACIVAMPSSPHESMPSPHVRDTVNDVDMSESPSEHQRDQASNDNKPGLNKKKKARRANRKRQRTWKPYSSLTWLERKELEEKEAAKAEQELHTPTLPSKRRKRGRGGGREQPPPAPRLTTQQIFAEHELELKNPEEIGLDEALQHLDHQSSSDSALSNELEDEFEKAYDECMHADLKNLDSLSHKELVSKVREQATEIDRLRAELSRVRRSDSGPRESAV